MKILCFISLVMILASCTPQTPQKNTSEVASYPFVVEDDLINFTHESGARGLRHIGESVGSGGALFDADGDGDLDLYLVQGTATDENSPKKNILLYQNDGEFIQGEKPCGAEDSGDGMSCAAGDIDNDGDIDLYVVNDGPDSLYLNDGTGHFTDVTQERGIEMPLFGSSICFLDVELDGDLDIFVGHYIEFSIDAFTPCLREKLEVYCAPKNYPGVPCSLLINDGKGFFSDASASSGLASLLGKALGVLTSDVDGDGDQDLYVANDGEANFLLLNQWKETGEIKFIDDAYIAGCALGEGAKEEAGMGVEAADLDGDGDEEILVTNFEAQTNSCYRNDGGGMFLETSFVNGMGPPSILNVAFGIRVLDVNLDLLPDIFITNGHVIDNIEKLTTGQTLFAQQDQLYINEGGTFKEVSPHLPAELKVGRALISGDIDNDGDLDLISTTWQGSPRVLRSTSAGSAPVIGLHLSGDGVSCHRDAIGAIINYAVQEKTITREHRVQSSYLASHDPRLLLTLGPKMTEAVVTVKWPGGTEETATLTAGSYHKWVMGKGIVSQSQFEKPTPN